MDTKKIARYVLGGLIVVGFFALLILLVCKTIPEGNAEMLHMVVGALIGSFVTVVGFYYGSSQSSQDKDEKLNSNA